MKLRRKAMPEQSLASVEASASPSPDALGARLVDSGALAAAELDRALTLQREHKGRFGDTLRRLGLVSDEDWARALAEELDLPFVEESELTEHALPMEQVSERFLKERCILPLGHTGEGIVLAMADPLDAYAVRAMQLVTGMTMVRRVAAERAIRSALDRLYESERSSVRDIIDEQAWAMTPSAEEDVERLKDLASEAPVVRLVDTILKEAVTSSASDIHIEPFEHRLAFRYRVDGVLREAESPAVQVAPALISRIKIMAGLNIAERRLAQDGRIRLRIQGRKVDLRVSTLPSLHGESVVIRLLQHDAVPPDFTVLGFGADNRASVEAMLASHDGVVLATGPTGSGKTTTLYAALHRLTKPECKIVTVEDPVEYEVPQVTQVHVNAEIGLTFANLLRSIVRHDPDIIMIGEMRDHETAEVAVRSALTGHMVLSSLHTNDAPGAVTRLLDMGVADYLVASTLRGVIAQRLVRRLCRMCRKPYEPEPELVRKLRLEELAEAAGVSSMTLYRARGCETCAQMGYKGRVGIYELIRPDDDFRKHVLQRPDAVALRAAALATGMTPMLDDGLGKALAGITSLEEVGRVIHMD